jgi:hypothetical protein
MFPLNFQPAVPCFPNFRSHQQHIQHEGFIGAGFDFGNPVDPDLAFVEIKNMTEEY